MSVTIDSLDIQIRSSAGSAAKNINDLADALSNLNSSAKITKVVNSLEKLNGSLAGMKSQQSVMSHLSALSKSLSSLASIPQLTGLRSAINELKKLPAVMQSLDTAKISQFATKMKQLADGLSPLATQIDKISKGFSKLPPQVSKCVTAVKRLDSANKSAAKSAKSHGDALNGQSINLLASYEHLQNVFSMIHGVQDAFAALLNGAIQWDGIQFQFGRAFGEDADMVLEYAEKVSDALKINQQQFMESASLYGSLLKGFGVAQEQVTTMAVGLAELSYDIWAAYNNRYKSLDDASEAVRSAITGEIEPIRNAGIALTEASMQEYLDSVGKAHISIEKLTEAQKSEVRYATMVNAAMNQGIIGTYAREMETAEGAVRTLTQQLTTLGQALGSLFIPMLKAVLPWISAFVELVTEGVVALAALFGIKFQEITWGDAKGMAQTAEGADATASALGDAAKSAKAMKDYTMGFDELNIIKPDSDTGAAGAGAGGIGSGDSLGLGLDTLWDDAVLASASKQIDELKEKIKEYINEHKLMLSVVGGTAAFLGFMKVLRGLNSLLGITKTIGNLKTAFKGLSTAAKGLKATGSNIKAFFQLLKEGSGLGNTLAAMFPKAANVLSSASTWVTGTLVPAFKTALTKLPSLLTKAVKAIPGWGWIAAAILAVLAGAIKLAITDYDFTDIGYKVGEALGSALKKVGEWFGSATDWVIDVAKSIKEGIVSAFDWVKENFEIDSFPELILSIINPVVLIGKIIPKMIEVGKEILPGLWQGVLDGWENLKSNISEFINGFIQGFKDGLGIASPSTVFAEIGSFLVEGMLLGITEKWEAVKEWFATVVAPKFTLEYWQRTFDTVRQAITTKLDEVKKTATEKWEGIVAWFNENIAPKFTLEYWRTWFDTVRAAISEKLTEVKQTLSDKWAEIKEWYNQNIAPKLTFNYWMEKFNNIKKSFVQTIKNAINAAINAVNSFINWINENLIITIPAVRIAGIEVFPGGTIRPFNIPTIPTLFADGGFPDVGQMFIAREAGPELVGNINGRTAVANNDQIVEAVSQGVYTAVVAAMSAASGGSGQNINVYLDGKQIYNSIRKRDSERGMQLIGDQLGYAY